MKNREKLTLGKKTICRMKKYYSLNLGISGFNTRQYTDYTNIFEEIKM